MIDISWLALQQWLRDRTQPKNYVFAVWLNEFIGSTDELPECFLNYNWNSSHDHPLVVFYDERVTVRTLEVLHNYFRQQSCDIENIIVVTSHGLGISDWWNDYVSLCHDRSFKIKEWLFVRSIQWQKYFLDLKVPDKKDLSKDIQRFFNSYSGTNPKVDRQYLSLKLRGLGDMGLVDMISEFAITKQQLINHAYYLGYFKNINEEQCIGSLYDRYVHDRRLVVDPMVDAIQTNKTKDEIFDFQGSQYQLDRVCLATVVNETDNSQPWCMVSEKTLRPFWHHNVVVHPGYQAISRLQAQGFWFPDDIIDYSYQHEPDWLTRTNLMIQSLERTHHKMSGRYQEYWSDNYQQFRSNALLLERYYRSD
jgi:hypothetical protein